MTGAQGPEIPSEQDSRRVDFEAGRTTNEEFYALLTAVVVPRPIAWVSTTSVEGVDNLAPHSFFTVAGLRPPVVQFTSVGRKDTLTNIEATGEFVVSLAPEWLFDQVNATGTGFPPAESEFDRVGVEREASARVTPPRVSNSPVALECKLHLIVPVGGCFVVMGEVIHAAVDGRVMVDGLPDFGLLQPLSRLGGDEWGLTPATRETTRIPYEDWPGHFKP